MRDQHPLIDSDALSQFFHSKTACQFDALANPLRSSTITNAWQCMHALVPKPQTVPPSASRIELTPELCYCKRRFVN